jgi:hypothetical protein
VVVVVVVMESGRGDESFVGGQWVIGGSGGEKEGERGSGGVRVCVCVCV